VKIAKAAAIKIALNLPVASGLMFGLRFIANPSVVIVVVIVKNLPSELVRYVKAYRRRRIDRTKTIGRKQKTSPAFPDHLIAKAEPSEINDCQNTIASR